MAGSGENLFLDLSAFKSGFLAEDDDGTEPGDLEEPANERPPGNGRDKPTGSIEAFLGNIRPDDVPALQSVRLLESLYPLVASLIGRNDADFLVRMGALESLVRSDRSVLSSEDLDSILFWLTPNARSSILRIFREGGWLRYDPQVGTTLTPAGRQVYEVFATLYRKALEGEIAPTLATLEMMNRTGQDPRRILAALRSRMLELQEEIIRAREQRSEIFLLASKAKLEETLKLSDYLRETVGQVVGPDRETRLLVKSVLGILSGLLNTNSQLEDDLTQISRQYVRLDFAVTPDQVVRALRAMDGAHLGEVARKALLPAYVPVPLLRTEALLAAAENFLARERTPAPSLEWKEPEAIEVAPLDASPPPAAIALVGDLAKALEEPLPFASIVPKGTAGESLYRNSLLSLLNDAKARRGVAGMLGSLGLEPETSNDGWPEPLDRGPLAAISPGHVRLKKKGDP